MLFKDIPHSSLKINHLGLYTPVLSCDPAIERYANKAYIFDYDGKYRECDYKKIRFGKESLEFVKDYNASGRDKDYYVELDVEHPTKKCRDLAEVDDDLQKYDIFVAKDWPHENYLFSHGTYLWHRDGSRKTFDPVVEIDSINSIGGLLIHDPYYNKDYFTFTRKGKKGLLQAVAYGTGSNREVYVYKKLPAEYDSIEPYQGQKQGSTVVATKNGEKEILDFVKIQQEKERLELEAKKERAKNPKVSVYIDSKLYTKGARNGYGYVMTSDWGYKLTTEHAYDLKFRCVSQLYYNNKPVSDCKVESTFDGTDAKSVELGGASFNVWNEYWRTGSTTVTLKVTVYNSAGKVVATDSRTVSY